jgi:hypothetical protein
MANVTYVASALLTGLFLAVVAGALARLGARRIAPTPTGRPERAGGLASTGYDALDGLVRKQTTWVAGFFLFTLGVVAGVIAFLQGDASAGVGAGLGLAGAGALALVGFLLFGTYFTVRSHGRSTAEAIGVGLWALGLLLVVAVALNLLVS